MENSQKEPQVTFHPQIGWRLALDRAPLFLSILLLFSLPFVTQIAGMHPIFPKEALTQILVYLILCAWTLKVVLTGRLVWIQTPAFWPLLALLGWILITIVFSTYPIAGWRSFSNWICFPLWYLLLTFTSFEAWKAENLLFVFLTAALGTSGWAVGQALGLGGGAWLEIVKNQFGGKVTAGLGNPDCLAGYLLLVWPLALALYLRTGRLAAKIYWSGLLVLSLLTLLWTGSKAGWVGLVVEVLVFSFFFFIKVDWWKSVLKILGISVATIILLVFLMPKSDRLKSLMDTRNDPIWFRATLWKGVVEMVNSHPLKGTGFGTFETAYPAYRPAALMMRQTERGYQVDHAQNWLLEWAAETGTVGLVLLLVFWWFIFSQWWRLFRANAIPKTLGAGVFAAFAGIGVENLFEVNSYLPTTLVPLLLFAALPVALSQRFYRLEGFPIRYREMDLSPYRAYLLPMLVVVIALSFQQIGKAFQRQLADVELKRAEAASRSGNWVEAIGFYNNALNFDPQNLEAEYFRGETFFNRNKEGDADRALADLEAVSRVSPDYLQLHFKKYEVLNQLKRPEDAKVELKKAVSLDPMLIYLLEDFKKARDLTSAGKFYMAFILYQNLYLDYPTCVPMMIDYANCFALMHDYSSAINLYRRVLELDPGNSKALYDLIKVSEAEKKVQGLKKNVFGAGL